ncbi:hypothetical protein [Acetobacterium carbinolicum]|uniref:hypothetical protein n=1 Tax=Acetobacterium carbinolicum TaxID=52690 RepID=UPI0039C993EC
MIGLLQLLAIIVPLSIYGILYLTVMYYLLLQIEKLKEDKKNRKLEKSLDIYIEKLKAIKSLAENNDPQMINSLDDLINEMVRKTNSQ